MLKQKKAISPVITTMALILLAITLAGIIFLWANGLIGEQISKFNRPIEESCGEVRLSGLINGESITVSNNGNVPVNGVGVRVTDSSGSARIQDITINLFKGSSLTITPQQLTLTGNKVDLIPILLGKSSKGGSSLFTCLNNAISIA